MPKVCVLIPGAKSDSSRHAIFCFCSTDSAEKENFFFQLDLKVSDLANYKILLHTSQSQLLCEER